MPSLGRLGERLLDALVKDRSIGKTSERVVICKMANLPFPALYLRDVGEKDHGSPVGALLGHKEPAVARDLAFVHAVGLAVPIHPSAKLPVQGRVELFRVVDQPPPAAGN